MNKIRKTVKVLDACAMHGIESHMIDNYPEWYIRRLVEAFEMEK